MLNITNECNTTLMARYPDKYFDLAIVDPPYFTGVAKSNFYGAKVSKTNVKRLSSSSDVWDSNIPDEKYFKELIRVSKNHICWGVNYYPYDGMPVGRLIWDKKNDDSTFSNCEIASCSLIDSVKIFRYMWNGMLQEDMKNKEKRIHPTQKPVALYKWILEKYAKPGDKILDTHLGSGSIAIACHDYGYDLTACELDNRYFDMTLKRIRDYTAQSNMFIKSPIVVCNPQS